MRSKQSFSAGSGCWFRPTSAATSGWCQIWYILALCLSLCLLQRALAQETPLPQGGNSKTSSQQQATYETSKSLPANHRMDSEEPTATTAAALGEEVSQSGGEAASKSGGRRSRQYDGSTPMGSSSTGSYAAIAGDSGAYVGAQGAGANYNLAGGVSGSPAGYGPLSDLSGAYQSGGGAGPYGHGEPMSMARGYAPPGYPMAPPSMSPFSSMFAGSMPGSGGSGLFSSGSPSVHGSMFPLMAKGFDVSEIVCTAIAVAIGAVIVGAPFILIYLFIMNQMNGNGPNMGPSGGAISLTGPTSSTTVNGRKKRHTSFPEALFKQLSPLMNNEQVAQTFKMLMNSIAKYQK